jgi:hypothetical protein
MVMMAEEKVKKVFRSRNTRRRERIEGYTKSRYGQIDKPTTGTTFSPGKFFS